VVGNEMNCLAIESKHITDLSVAQASGAMCNHFKNWLGIRR
jgi:hypothetical protein